MGSQSRVQGKSLQDMEKPTKFLQVQQLGPALSFHAAGPDPEKKKKISEFIKLMSQLLTPLPPHTQ